MAAGIARAARERLLDVAEHFFIERGYTAVTLRDIANALGIRQASLYYHVPEGKEQLFVMVLERGLERHRVALDRAIEEAAPNLREQLRASARWLLSQTPIDLARMVRSDIPAISHRHAQQLEQATYRALLQPIERALVAARDRGEIRLPHPMLVAVSFLTLIEGIHEAHRFTSVGKEAMAEDVIDILLDGLRPR
jgi:AcrR family transcriptional regulator